MLALLVVLLGPQPLSACALVMGLPADCAPAAPAESDCGQMPMEAPAAPRHQAEPECCGSLTAPLPQASVALASAEVATVPTEAAAFDTPVLRVAAAPTPVTEPAASPPRQPLLCVFLI